MFLHFSVSILLTFLFICWMTCNAEMISQTIEFQMPLFLLEIGLNLTEANNVILADCWFNPSVEEQCCDRAHRIGQRSKVRVTRMKIIGTVEEKIYDMCRRKSETCKAALGENGSSTLGRQKMTLEDALELFGNAAENVARNANAGASARQAAMDIGRLLCSDV